VAPSETGDRDARSSQVLFTSIEEEIYMSKLLAILIAGTTLAFAAPLMAADNTNQSNPQAKPTQSQPTQQEQVPMQKDNKTSNPQARQNPDGTQSPEYAAALKKCDSMSGSSKTDCVDAAKKKYGQM
jgi:hypothetical protein